MLYATRARTCLVVFVVAVGSACGSGSPSEPTRPYTRGTETLSGPNLAAHSSFCKDFDNAKAGPVSVDVTPPSIHLILGTGTCKAPGQILAAKDGEVTNVDAPEGSNHVTLSNRSNTDTPFTLRIIRWY